MRKYLIISIVTSLVLSSCNDLTLNPLSQGSSENWYSNETEIQMALNRVFSNAYFENLRFPKSDFLGAWYESYADDYIFRESSISEWAGGTLNGATGFVGQWWTTWYQCIASANLIVEKAVKAKGEISEAKLNQYIANAKFARAVHYSMLIFYFGDVPFYTNTPTIEEAFNMSRTAKNVILDEIYKDFDFGIANLPLKYPDNEVAYATKGAALAMKARIALYMGDWATARNAAKQCMDLNQYELYSDFFNLFGQKNYSTKEFIFILPRSVAYNLHILHNSQINDRNSGGFSTYGPSWDLFCSFLCTDGLPIDKSPLFNPREPFKNRDPRCSATLVEHGTYFHGIKFEVHPDTLKVWNKNTNSYQANKNSIGVDQYACYNGINLKKYMGDGWYDYATKFSDPANIVMRYADLLLMYAEAKIELNEIDQTVLDAINRVRARAYKVPYTQTSSYPAVTTTNQSALRKIVRVERRMELAWECRRLADILRWRIAEKVLNRPIYGLLSLTNIRNNVVKPGNWFWPEVPPIDEDGCPDFTSLANKGMVRLLARRTFNAPANYLLPIPTKEILVNANLVQNPGY